MSQLHVRSAACPCFAATSVSHIDTPAHGMAAAWQVATSCSHRAEGLPAQAFWHATSGLSMQNLDSAPGFACFSKWLLSPSPQQEMRAL